MWDMLKLAKVLINQEAHLLLYKQLLSSLLLDLLQLQYLECLNHLQFNGSTVTWLVNLMVNKLIFKCLQRQKFSLKGDQVDLEVLALLWVEMTTT